MHSDAPGREQVAVPTRLQTHLGVVAISGSACATACAGWTLWRIPQHTRTVEMVVAEYLFAACIAALILVLLSRLQQPISIPHVNHLFVDVPIAIAVFFSIRVLGMHQFAGYDHSSMIEAGWLQLSPLIPFKDYPCTFPPLFILGNRYAFLAFGVRWSAFVLLMAAFAVLSFVFLTRQFRALGCPSVLAAALALTGELGTSVVCSFWWYNALASLVGIMVLVSTLVCIARSHDPVAWLLLGVSFTLLVLSKPNVWPIGACVASLYFTRDASQRIRALAVLVLGSTIAGLVCWLNNLNPLDIIQTYFHIADTRGNPLRMIGFTDFWPVEGVILLVVIAVIILFSFAVLISNRKEIGHHWREYFCCIVTALTSLVMASMNFELKTSDLAPLVTALAVMAFRPWSQRRFGRVGFPVVVFVTVFFVTLSAWWAVTRLRIRATGEGMFFEGVQTTKINTGFFAGLYTGPRFPRVLQQIDAALTKFPSDKVFFGPRMEFSYAAFNRNPPKGVPIWWHPGTSFPISDFLAVSRAFENGDFDLMIFLKGDYIRMPSFYVARKLRSYERVSDFSELDVYIRKKDRLAVIQPNNMLVHHTIIDGVNRNAIRN